MPRTFKEMLAGDELIPVFALSKIVNPIVIEMFALSGSYKGFWLDWEHAFITTEQIVTASLAARANDFDCFVRLPPAGYWSVTQCLEAGAGGVMAAQIHSAAQAEQFVRWTKFAPEGERGLNIGGRDAGYTHVAAAEFVEQANRRHFTAIQIETAGAVKEVDAIAAIKGVDLLFIGPADLSLALGVVGQFHHKTLWNAIDKVAQACRDHGKAWGCVAPDAKFADRAIGAGCRMPTIGNELVALRRGLEAIKKQFSV